MAAKTPVPEGYESSEQVATRHMMPLSEFSTLVRKPGAPKPIVLSDNSCGARRYWHITDIDAYLLKNRRLNVIEVMPFLHQMGALSAKQKGVRHDRSRT
jgi:hypothetical protein